MARPLDRKLQARIWDAIKDFCQEHGYSPCLRDIQSKAGVSSPSVVRYHLRILEREGRITWEPAIARSVRVVEERRG